MAHAIRQSLQTCDGNIITRKRKQNTVGANALRHAMFFSAANFTFEAN